MITDYLGTTEEILKYNAVWWKNTPNETYTRDDGYDFPTNQLTAYTLNEIGNDINIVTLNQYCISLEGQPSSIKGENTLPGARPTNYVYQREYLTIMIPKTKARDFIQYFNSKCLLVVEEYELKRCRLFTKTSLNENAKRFITPGKNSIWLTATQNQYFKDTRFITNLPITPGAYNNLTIVDSIFFRVTDKVIGSLDDFVTICLVNPNVGLSDPPLEVIKFKENGGGGILKDSISPAYPGYSPLIIQVIKYFETHP
jgi:hypothetical protein